MSLVILVPMLGRPHHVAPLLESIAATTPDEWRALFVLTPGDDEVEAAVQVAAGKDGRVDILHVGPHARGDYSRKINAGIAATDEEHIFTGASDLRFHPGWYEAALAMMTPGIGVVGTNDLGNLGTRNGGHATHFLVTRWYVEQHGTIDEPGKFYHEGYPHEFVDNEAYETAKTRRMYAHARDAIVEHLHPLWGKASWDPMYEQMRHRIDVGSVLFRERRLLWRHGLR